jgi:hypothetical protein
MTRVDPRSPSQEPGVAFYSHHFFGIVPFGDNRRHRPSLATPLNCYFPSFTLNCEEYGVRGNFITLQCVMSR